MKSVIDFNTKHIDEAIQSIGDRIFVAFILAGLTIHTGMPWIVWIWALAAVTGIRIAIRAVLIWLVRRRFRKESL